MKRRVVNFRLEEGVIAFLDATAKNGARSRAGAVRQTSQVATAIMLAAKRQSVARLLSLRERYGEKAQLVVAVTQGADGEPLGVEHRRIYDTRHTFASWALRDGVSLFYLSRVMGSPSRKSTRPTDTWFRTAKGTSVGYWTMATPDVTDTARRRPSASRHVSIRRNVLPRLGLDDFVVRRKLTANKPRNFRVSRYVFDRNRRFPRRRVQQTDG